MLALALTLVAAPLPRAALFDDALDRAAVARARPPSEPLREVAEYAAALGAFTAVNAAGVAFVSSGTIRANQTGSVSLSGATGALTGAAICFALSPLASAIGSWAVGKTSDHYDSPLGAAVLGAYGSSAVAIGAGLGLSAAGINRTAGIAVNTALYLAVPLGTVLVQNAFKDPLPNQP